MRLSTAERLLNYVRHGPGGCWLWIGGKTRGGYGKFQLCSKTCLAHRVAYELFIGPIDCGLQIDHLCRNRGCVNPEHLEPVTCRENLLRGNTLQAENSAKTHCPKGHAYSPENTYRHKDGRRVCKSCRRLADNQDGPRERRKLYKRAIRAGQHP
jgi:hypothetical protein